MADSFASLVRRNAYVDSVTLLQVSADMIGLTGVRDAALVMASELNRQLLSDSGMLVGDAPTAGPNDLIIAVRATDDALAATALQQAEALLAGRRRHYPASPGAAARRSADADDRAGGEAIGARGRPTRTV